ncbi:MAG: magnesium/cobalt transporter CorA [Candidatus Lokiarchaeota archaeon]|nr:magnesium/cobalt transporter CorA [Candidatus Lokiarchaeota archaeon]
MDDISKGMIRWIRITGLTDAQLFEKLSVKLHPLVMEDILNPFQRPKFEDYGEYIFIILKKMIFDQSSEQINSEQISLILGKNYVISFEEIKSEIFDMILERIKVPKGRIRFMGPDYLMYALIDVIVDNYFIILEYFGVFIEEIEDVLINEPKPATLQRINELKRKTIEIRKSIWPMREVINKLQREQSKLISDDLQYYLRDIYDHIFRITDLLENYRDIIFGMLDMYLSSVSNRMNDIMKVLTIISTVFIPLSFLSGFYGMNFHYMPELANPLAYPILILVMISIFSVMLLYFRRKKWI